jgi:hypothetical protein
MLLRVPLLRLARRVFSNIGDNYLADGGIHFLVISAEPLQGVDRTYPGWSAGASKLVDGPRQSLSHLTSLTNPKLVLADRELASCRLELPPGEVCRRQEQDGGHTREQRPANIVL